MRGAIAYYAFLMVFMVVFVAVVGTRTTITGNAVLYPDTLPIIRDADAIRAEIGALAAPKPITPTAAYRTFIIPKPGVAESALHAIAPPKHFFANGFSADITAEQRAQLEPLAILEPIPIYFIQPFEPQDLADVIRSKTQSMGIPAEVTIALLSTPSLALQHGCRDFTHGPQILDTCEYGTTDTTGTELANLVPDASLTVYQVCDAQGQCFADDVAVAVTYTADRTKIIVLPLGGAPSSVMADTITKTSSALVIAAVGDGEVLYPAAYPGVVSI